MKRGEVRDIQLANLIAEELSFVLSSANDSRLGELNITGVESKPGGRHFIVYVAPQQGSTRFGSSAEMKAALKKAAGFLRSELAELLNLKRTPDLTFLPDPFYSFPLVAKKGDFPWS